jgi:hypothetical protein
VSLRAVLSRKDTGKVWRSSLLVREGVAHMHLQQVLVSAEACPELGEGNAASQRHPIWLGLKVAL